MEFDVNYIAVFIAAVSGMVIGAAWYSKFLFGSQWMTLMGFTDEHKSKAQKGMAKSFALGFVAQLVMAYVLAYFVQLAGVASIAGALTLGFWVWIGFVATAMLGIVLWEGKSTKLYVINAGYQLVSILVMATVLAVWV